MSICLIDPAGEFVAADDQREVVIVAEDRPPDLLEGDMRHGTIDSRAHIKTTEDSPRWFAGLGPFEGHLLARDRHAFCGLVGRSGLGRVLRAVVGGAAIGGLGNLAILEELCEFGTALKKLERALLLDGLRGRAGIIAFVADGLDDIGTLGAPGESADGRKGVFSARLDYFCIDHVKGNIS